MIISVAEIERFAYQALVANGVRDANARIVSGLIAKADCYGVSTHGIARLGAYFERIRAGVQELDPEIRIVEERPATALLDAGNGWGQLAAIRGMDLAISKAKNVGVGAVSVANSNHFGVAGHYVEHAAAAGCIGISMTNASPAMAPFNAKEALLGTNPIAFGIPRARGESVVLDMSSSIVARGKIRRAFNEGVAEIPQGWAVGLDGKPTTDPGVALAGMLAPIGGAKGAGLSLIIDMLSGMLSGTSEVGGVANILDTSRPSRTGHMLIAIDPSAFIGRAEFETEVERTVGRINAMEPADGSRVMVPGELERERAERARREGVVLPADVQQELLRIADELQVAPISGISD